MAYNLFVDSDILLDVILNRKPFVDHSLELFIQRAYDLKLHLKVYHYRQTDYKPCFFFRCFQRTLSGLKFLGALPKSPTNSLAFSFFVDGLEISFSKCSSTILDILVSFCLAYLFIFFTFSSSILKVSLVFINSNFNKDTYKYKLYVYQHQYN